MAQSKHSRVKIVIVLRVIFSVLIVLRDIVRAVQTQEMTDIVKLGTSLAQENKHFLAQQVYQYLSTPQASPFLMHRLRCQRVTPRIPIKSGLHGLLAREKQEGTAFIVTAWIFPALLRTGLRLMTTRQQQRARLTLIPLRRSTTRGFPMPPRQTTAQGRLHRLLLLFRK